MDIGTRGATVKALQRNDTWRHSPTWLKLHPARQPSVRTDYQSEHEEKPKSTVLLGTEAKVRDVITRVEKYSSLLTLLRATAWVLQFAHNARCKERHEGPLNGNELNDAEQYWI